MAAEMSPALKKAIENCFMDERVRYRSYYPDFRRAWVKVFELACEKEEAYFDFSAPQCYTVHHEFGGFEFDFHFDQLRICDWYEKELQNRKKIVFSNKRLKRTPRSGELMFHDSVCRYEPEAEESALEDNMRNIIACALPYNPPELRIVYGSKWVDTRFNPLRRRSLDIFFIGTDYVPAFLGSPLEAAVYLFLMDCCIIKENLGKAKDEDIKPLLHIMRPSPMLRIKGLV